MNKKLITISMTALFILMSTACSTGNNQHAATGAPSSAPTPTPNHDPVTLSVVSDGAGIYSDAELQDLMKPVHDMYPNITLKLVQPKNMQELVTSGDIPDIVLTSNYYLYGLLDMGLGSDLNPFVSAYKVDLSQFEPQTINILKAFGKNGELYGIPYAMNYGALIYNKDIFDKFGVEYPKAGMTWNQTIELSKKLTRSSDGTQYLGLDPITASTFVRQAALPLIGSDGKVALTSNGFVKVFSILKSIYDIPGMVDSKINYTKDNIDLFMKDKRVAMEPYWVAAWTSRAQQLQQQNQDFNWDITSYPSLDDHPGYGREVDFHLMMVTPTSKNKEAAYEAINAMIGKSAQTVMNKGSRITALKDPAIKKDFASGLDTYKGKNIASIFAVQPGSLPLAGKYDGTIYNYLNSGMQDMVLKNLDINTVLRDAEGKSNDYVQKQSK